MAALFWLATSPAVADHGGPPPARSGFDWTSWLLVAGAVAAVCLAAWAFFAPARPEERPEPQAPHRPGPEPRTPTAPRAQ